MKNKIFKAVSILVTCILLLINIPTLFENKIIQKVKWAGTDLLHAKVDFEKLKLSLFRSFPHLNIELKNLSLTGTGELDNSKLLTADQLSISVNLSSLWSSDGLTISSMILQHPSINLTIDKSGKSNWYAPSKTISGNQQVSSKKSTVINLDNIEVNNSRLSYKNEASPMFCSLRNGNFKLSGAIKRGSSRLQIQGQADSLNFELNGSRYLSNMKISIKTELQSNSDKKSYTIIQNEFLINKLPVEFQGTFSSAEGVNNYDLTFNSPASSLADLLGFIPEKYQKNFIGVETSGAISFGGFVKGTASGTSLPAFSTDLKIAGGRLKYPKLPKEIDQIEVLANISKPQGEPDLTRIDIGKAEVSIAGNPVKASLFIATPVTDPRLHGNITGVVDFTVMKQVFPMESTDLNGILDASVDFDGSYSSIEKGMYENFKTDGQVTLKDFAMSSAKLPQKLEIRSATIGLNPKSISLTNLTGKFGESDFTINGSLTNYWGYLLKKGILNGNIALNSGYFNFNQLISNPGPKSTASDSLRTDKPAELGEYLNLTIQSSVNKALYERINISAISGKVIIAQRKVILEGLSMNMLRGKILVSGTYATPPEMIPDFDFKIDIKDFDLPTAYQSSGTIRHFLPAAGQSSGSFSSAILMTGKIGTDNAPVFTTLNGGGNLTLKNIEMAGAGFFNDIAKYFRKDLFRRVRINDFTTTFKMVNGGINITPFSTKLAGQDVTISGKQSAELNLDYKIYFKVNKEDLSSDVNSYIGFVPGAENIKKYPILINLGGSFEKPDVKVDLTEAKDLVAKEFTKSAGSVIQDALKKFGLDKLFK